ncbi:conserved protein of unknown function [Tenacibaculum sp. 190524A02b]|uniref:hypothetical protein n=1 Tax=Tenacibaculum vairaonense TaxID=3137860 RepID=UPI0032B20E68
MKFKNYSLIGLLIKKPTNYYQSFMLIFFISISSNLYSQSLDTLINRAELIYKDVKPNLWLSKNGENASLLLFGKDKENKTKNINQLLIDLKKLQASQFLMDLGLVFKASANYNFRNIFEEETNLFNIGRASMEVEWNILKNGFIHNRTKAKQLFNDIKGLKQKDLEESKILWRRQFRIDYSYVYNTEVLFLFEKFLEFENQYFDFLSSMYTQKLVKREPLIKVGNQIHILENQIEVIKKENAILKDKISVKAQELTKLSLFVLNIDDLELSKTIKEVKKFEKRNVLLEHRAINDLSLSLYAGQSYLIGKGKNIYFPNVGLRFRAPIRFNHRKKIIKTKIKLLESQFLDKSVGQQNRLITQVNSYNEKLKDLQNQYKNSEVISERIRILKVLKEELDNPETGLLILSLMEEKFKVLENIMQIKRQLYTILSHVFELHSEKNINKLIAPFVYNSKLNSETLMISSNSNYSLTFQIQLLKAKRQEVVYVVENDLKAINYLIKNKITYKTVKAKSYKTVANYIDKKLKNLF